MTYTDLEFQFFPFCFEQTVDIEAHKWCSRTFLPLVYIPRDAASLSVSLKLISFVDKHYSQILLNNYK